MVYFIKKTQNSFIKTIYALKYKFSGYLYYVNKSNYSRLGLFYCKIDKEKHDYQNGMQIMMKMNEINYKVK